MLWTLSVGLPENWWISFDEVYYTNEHPRASASIRRKRFLFFFSLAGKSVFQKLGKTPRKFFYCISLGRGTEGTSSSVD